MPEEINQEKIKAVVTRCQNQLDKFPRIRKYLNERMITDEMIKEFEIGYGSFYNRNYISVPVKDTENNYLFIKLRRDPEDTANKNKFKVYPLGAESTIYGMDQLVNGETIVIVEGELDRIIMQSQGVPSISSTAGALGWKKDWMFVFKNCKKIFICFDKDEAGDKGAEKLGQMILEEHSNANVFKTVLPEIVGGGKDITDLAIANNGIINIDDLFYELSSPIRLVRKAEPVVHRAEFSGDAISQSDVETASKVDCSKFVKIERVSNGVSFAKCPFHKNGNEKTPSLACYEGGKGFFCFSCSAGGDSISLVQKMYSLEFKEAINYILKK